MPPMRGVSFQVKFEALAPAVAKWGKLAMEAGGAALYMEAEGIMRQAKDRCPMDTGSLRASGHVQAPVVLAGQFMSVALGFGGPAGFQGAERDSTGYAVFVHEDLSKHHPVGEAKFLEKSILEWQPRAEERLAKRLKQTLKMRGL